MSTLIQLHHRNSSNQSFDIILTQPFDPTKVTAGNITPAKKEFFQKRLNILPSFKAKGKQEL